MKIIKTGVHFFVLTLMTALCITGPFRMKAVHATEPNTVDFTEGSGPLELGANGIGNIFAAIAPGTNAYGMKFGYISDSSKLFSLSDEDRLALLLGKNIDLSLVADLHINSTSPTQDIKNIQSAIDNSVIEDKKPELISYIDVSLFKEIRDSSANKARIMDTNIPVTLVMNVPDTIKELRGGLRRAYYIYTITDDAVSSAGPFYENSKRITFSLSTFTTFGLAYVDVPVSSGATATAPAAPKEYVPYNAPATTAAEIQSKVDNMINSSMPNPVYPSSFTEEDVQRVEEPDFDGVEAEPKDQVILVATASNTLSPYKTIPVLLVIDLVIVGLYILISPRRKA